MEIIDLKTNTVTQSNTNFVFRKSPQSILINDSHFLLFGYSPVIGNLDKLIPYIFKARFDMMAYLTNLIKEIFDLNSGKWSDFLTLDLECRDLQVKTSTNTSVIFLFEKITLQNKLNVYSLDVNTKYLKHLYLAPSKNLLYVTLLGDSMIRIYKPSQPTDDSDKAYQDFVVKSNRLKPSLMFKTSKTNIMSITTKRKKKNFSLTQNSLDRDQVFSRPHTHQLMTPLESLIQALTNKSSEFLLKIRQVKIDSFSPNEFVFTKALFHEKWDVFTLIKKGPCPKILGFDFDNLKLKSWDFPILISDLKVATVVKMNLQNSKTIL